MKDWMVISEIESEGEAAEKIRPKQTKMFETLRRAGRTDSGINNQGNEDGTTPSPPDKKSKISKAKKAELEPILWLDVEDQHLNQSTTPPASYYEGSEISFPSRLTRKNKQNETDGLERAFASTSIVDGTVTIELHGDKYHIAARFNVETTISGYNSADKDGHELHFHSICLQYMNRRGKERLVMQPESDATTAFTVTRNSNTSINGTLGVKGSQTPSANVSLGFTRSTGLTVEYAVKSWTVSSHRVVNGASGISPPKGVFRTLKAKIGMDANEEKENNVVRYQWFWAGTQDETKKLTPDLTQTVKRHVVVKRVIDMKDFPIERVKAARRLIAAERVEKTANVSSAEKREILREATLKATKEWERARAHDKRQKPSLKHLLCFDFAIQVRVKRRFGRFHQVILLSGNTVKAGFLKPSFNGEFRIRPTLGESEADIPLLETPDIGKILINLKKKHKGHLDDLQGQCVSEMREMNDLMRPEDLWSRKLITENEPENPVLVESQAQKLIKELKQVISGPSHSTVVEETPLQSKVPFTGYAITQEDVDQNRKGTTKSIPIDWKTILYPKLERDSFGGYKMVHVPYGQVTREGMKSDGTEKMAWEEKDLDQRTPDFQKQIIHLPGGHSQKPYITPSVNLSVPPLTRHVVRRKSPKRKERERAARARAKEKEWEIEREGRIEERRPG